MRNVYRWYSVGRWLHERGVPVLPRAMTLWIRLVFGGYIPHKAQIGPGTSLGYGGLGIVIHDDCVIGRDCSISQQVTLGGGRGGPGAHGRDVPVLGDRVKVGAGAKILGAVTLGDDCVVGANAVVTRDVEPGTVVAGIPAKPITSRAAPDTQRA